MGLLIGRGCEISHASSVYASLVLPQASSGDGTSRGCYMLIILLLVEEEVVKEAMKEKKKEAR